MFAVSGGSEIKTEVSSVLNELYLKISDNEVHVCSSTCVFCLLRNERLGGHVLKYYQSMYNSHISLVIGYKNSEIYLIHIGVGSKNNTQKRKTTTNITCHQVSMKYHICGIYPVTEV